MQSKFTNVLLSVSLFLTFPAFAQEEETMPQSSDVRKPAVSGSFYPASKERLTEQLTNFLKSASISGIPEDKRLLAIIVPHAGYDYSGGVAGHSFKLLEDKPYSSVVLIGPSHYVGFDGISIYPKGAWRTPLGDINVDEELSQEFMSKTDKIYFYPPAHTREHCLEVELPFLQVVWRKDFKIVPLVMGDQDIEDAEILGRVFAEILKERKDVLLVVSADLSHYHPYNEAVRLDRRALSDIEQLDVPHFIEGLKNDKIEIDAPGVIVATMLAAKQLGATKAELLKYANSGDVTGDKSRVVGYAAMAIYVENQISNIKNQKLETKKEPSSDLNEEQQKQLLKLARDTIENYVRNKTLPNVDIDDPALLENSGVFVTLNKYSRLRGCIGFIEPAMPLYQAVQNAAISAATKDYRFLPVKESELTDIKIELSVLSPLKKIDRIEDIEVGKDGLFIEKGFNSGLLLPQVATDYGWDRLTFLEETCRKAGLPPEAYKEKSSRIFVFSAQIFGEEE